MIWYSLLSTFFLQSIVTGNGNSRVFCLFFWWFLSLHHIHQCRKEEENNFHKTDKRESQTKTKHPADVCNQSCNRHHLCNNLREVEKWKWESESESESGWQKIISLSDEIQEYGYNVLKSKTSSVWYFEMYGESMKALILTRFWEA